jgi:hypothetical protein
MVPDSSLPISEDAEFQARYAAAMHLHAKRKIRIAAWLFTVAAIIAAIYFHSVWPLAIAFALDVGTYFLITNSCVRFVEAQTGMPAHAQVLCSQRYKSDAEFARNVDALMNSSQNS